MNNKKGRVLYYGHSATDAWHEEFAMAGYELVLAARVPDLVNASTSGEIVSIFCDGTINRDQFLSFLPQVRANQPSAIIVVFADGLSNVAALYSQGATVVLRQPDLVTPEEMLALLDSHHGRFFTVSADHRPFIYFRKIMVSTTTRLVMNGPKRFEDLSDRAYAILKYFAEVALLPPDAKDLMRAVWGKKVTARTLNRYIVELTEKIGDFFQID